jgi:hypothetical protein
MYDDNDEIISIGENHTRDISVYFVFEGQITKPPAVTVRKIRIKNMYFFDLLRIEFGC